MCASRLVGVAWFGLESHSEKLHQLGSSEHTQVEYAIKVAKKMQRECLRSIEPKSEAIAEFDEYLEVSSRREFRSGMRV